MDSSSSSIWSESLDKARASPLSRMLASAQISGQPRNVTLTEKLERWMINDGARLLFLCLFTLVHVLIFAFGFVGYYFGDKVDAAGTSFGITYPVARAAALVLHFDVAILVFPVCRTLVSLLRQTPLNRVVRFDRSIAFHKLAAWSIVVFACIHIAAHMNNFAQLAAKNGLGFRGFVLANFATGPGWSGWIMTVALMTMVFTSSERMCRRSFERFWYAHHLFILFFLFWSVHGAFCMIQADGAPFCFSTGTFYQFWACGGFIYLAERIMREVRGRHRTYVSKVIQHPGSVVEIQIKKERIRTRAGQYIFLCCPEVSVWRYHPFTLTSAPDEDHISIHTSVADDFTRSLAQALGCHFEKGGEKKPSGSEVVSVGPGSEKADMDPSIRRILPRVYIDGPFGNASEGIFKYEICVLVGAGIGAIPFASILKSIWYRMNYPKERTRLRKVYFFWVCRDFGSFEWFRSLLMAIESQDIDNRIEIHTYLTAKTKTDGAVNMPNNLDADPDAVTGLRAPTNFGRPNWDVIFKCIRRIHSTAGAGVFYSGPNALGSALHVKCNMYSDPDFKFRWNHENF